MSIPYRMRFVSGLDLILRFSRPSSILCDCSNLALKPTYCLQAPPDELAARGRRAAAGGDLPELPSEESDYVGSDESEVCMAA